MIAAFRTRKTFVRSACCPLLAAVLILGCHKPKPDDPEEPPIWAGLPEENDGVLSTDVPAGVTVDTPDDDVILATDMPTAATPATTGVALEPSPARPFIIAPGDSFFYVTRLPAGLGNQMFITLVHSVVPQLRYPLKNATPLSLNEDKSQGSMIVECPADVADGLYDIELEGEHATYSIPHCVYVCATPRSKFRVIHLSDMNIDDPSAPNFDSRLIDEINLLAPEFIIATGDFTDWSQTLNDPTGWDRTMAYLTQFDAPVYVICGDHDHNESFGVKVANGAIGTIDYGKLHGLLLWDNAVHRIDPDQIKWVIEDLKNHSSGSINFIAENDDDLTLLDRIAERVDNLPKFVHDTNLRMIITGGHTDWDYLEYAERLRELPDLNYIRTHQSSTCLRDRATGVSHYRVIEFDDDKFSYVYPDDVTGLRAQHSIPSGRLRVFYDVANDGSQPRVTATVQNALNQPFENCRLWLRVAKSSSDASRKPTAAGGKIVQTFDAGDHWACRISVDLPDKGGARVRITTDGDLPPETPVSFALEGDRDLTFRPQVTATGLAYFASPQTLNLVMTNTGSQPVVCWPIIRLNGSQLSVDRSETEEWPVKLDAGASATLKVNLTLGRVSPGPHLLQVFFLDDPLKRLTTYPVTLIKAES